MKNKGGAPKGNTNARRGETSQDARLSCRCTPALRDAVLHAAASVGAGSVGRWIMDAIETKLRADSS